MNATTALANTWCERYFREFLPGLMNQLLLPELSTLTTCFEIEIQDYPGPPWRLAVDSGRLVYVGFEGGEPVCRFGVDLPTLRRVVSAVETPQEAFFDMRITLDGDIEMGLKLSTVLGPFFALHPFEG